MICLGTKVQGQLRRRAIQILGQTYFKGEWMESGEDRQLSPTVSLIEQPPNSTLVPHFHRQNQFQLFVGGAGTIGQTSLEPVIVHYAGAYTGYGPLVSGVDGIKYFTMRPVCESGLLTIAESREQMIQGPKRHAYTTPIQVALTEDLLNLANVQLDTPMPFSDDGLGVTVVRQPRGTQLGGVTVPNSEGQFLGVLAGTLRYLDIEVGQWESLFISGDDVFPMLLAGDSGVQVVSMHVPRKAAAYL